MISEVQENQEFLLAKEYVLYTGQSVFLSGKAGTGKTTFLRTIAKQTAKKMAIAAPTGIAAINAGGVTLHSLLQLPIGTFIANGNIPQSTNTAYNKAMLLKNLRLNGDKKRMLRELDLLVIDEVSMLRCDTLDAIDAVLRHVRFERYKVFGGLQLLFIGDLQQLSPVCNPPEWELLSPYYASPFFFSAASYTEAKPIYIEFQKIYRQKDQQFIDLLNRIRNNKPTSYDINLLNTLYNPAATPEKGAVWLTTHNEKADRINKAQMEALVGDSSCYTAKITGDFSEKNFPTDEFLTLKVGAQVMFVKNDVGPEKRYYNGRLAEVITLNEEDVVVRCHDNDELIAVSFDTWKTIRYIHDEEEDALKEKETGSFTQLPIKLAWAITIHKSQGLTFDNLMIDAADAFAAGQVYVALSRCRSLNGITLTTPIHTKAIFTDDAAMGINSNLKSNEELSAELLKAKAHFAYQQLMKLFKLEKVSEAINTMIAYTIEKKLVGKEAILDSLILAQDKVNALEEVSRKFIAQLEQFFSQRISLAIIGEDRDWLGERIGKAMVYFANEINTCLLSPLASLQVQLNKKSGIKQYCAQLMVLQDKSWSYISNLSKLKFEDLDFENYRKGFPIRAITTKKTGKTVKGDSEMTTLSMLEEGFDLNYIAKERGLSLNTIENHIVKLVKNGSLPISKVLNMDRVIEVTTVAALLKTTGLTPIKEKLGGDFSYWEIKLALASIAK